MIQWWGLPALPDAGGYPGSVLPRNFTITHESYAYRQPKYALTQHQLPLFLLALLCATAGLTAQPGHRDSLTAARFRERARDKADHDAALTLLDSAVHYARRAGLPRKEYSYQRARGLRARAAGRSHLASEILSDSRRRSAVNDYPDDAYLAGYLLAVVLLERYAVDSAAALAEELIANPPPGDDRSSQRTFAYLHNIAGQVASNRGDYAAALNWYQRGITAAHRDDFPDIIPVLHNNTAIVYEQIHDRAAAYREYQRARQTMPDSSHQLWNIVQCNLALMEWDRGEVGRARERYRAVLDQHPKSLLDSCVAAVALGSILADGGDPDRGLPLLRSGLRLAGRITNPHQQIVGRIHLGRYWRESGRPDSAHLYYAQAVDTIRAHGSSNFAVEYAESLRGLLASELALAGNADALALLDTLTLARDSVTAGERVAAVAGMRVKYETAERERENELLRERDRENRRLLWGGLLGGGALLLAVGLAGMYYYRYSRLLERQERKLAEELRLLRQRTPDPAAFVSIRRQGMEERLPVDDIIYLKGQGRVAEFYLAGGERRLAARSFAATHGEPPADRLLRIQGTVAINLGRMRQAGPGRVIMEDGRSFEVKRSYRKRYREALAQLAEPVGP